MPHIDVTWYTGRSQQKKEEVAAKIKQFCVDELGFADEHLSVSFDDYAPDDFVKGVHSKVKPQDILIESSIIKK